jgi:hypothetical protein
MNTENVRFPGLRAGVLQYRKPSVSKNAGTNARPNLQLNFPTEGKLDPKMETRV